MLENSYWQEVLSVCAPGLHDPRDHFCILLLSVLYRNLPCLLQLVPVASAFQFDFMGEPCQEAGGREVREESCKPASGWVCHSLQYSGFLQDSLLWLWESVTPLPFRPGGDNSNSALATLGYTPLGSIPAFVNKSVQFSHSVMSDFLWPHGLQASLSFTNSQNLLKPCPLSWWCHPNNSSSVVRFSSCLPSFPESASFPMSQCFASGGQSIGVSASTSVLPMNIQGLFPLGLTGWIFLQSKGLSQESPPTPQFKSISSLVLNCLYSPTLTFIHDYWKNHSFD